MVVRVAQPSDVRVEYSDRRDSVIDRFDPSLTSFRRYFLTKLCNVEQRQIRPFSIDFKGELSLSVAASCLENHRTTFFL